MEGRRRHRRHRSRPRLTKSKKRTMKWKRLNVFDACNNAQTRLFLLSSVFLCACASVSIGLLQHVCKHTKQERNLARSTGENRIEDALASFLSAIMVFFSVSSFFFPQRLGRQRATEPRWASLHLCLITRTNFLKVFASSYFLLFDAHTHTVSQTSAVKKLTKYFFVSMHRARKINIQFRCSSQFGYSVDSAEEINIYSLK